MASPAIQRSPLQRLSTFKDTPPTTTTTATPSAAATPRTTTTTTTTSPLSPSFSVLDTFSSDPIFSAFLSDEFDSTRFSSAALSSGSAASRIEKLQEGLRLLDSQLRVEVLSRHEDLLNQLSSIKATDSALSSLRSSVVSLQSSVKKVRSELSDPHRAISGKTLQLSNIHSTTELLQSTIRVLRLSRKLRDLFDSCPDPERLDLSKAAQLHFEILSLYNEYHLIGIDAVDSELKWVVEIGQKLRSEGMKVLERGMEGLNQAEVGAGLQVFYNMGELRGTVDGLVSKYKAMATKSVSVALDMKAISAGGGGGGGGGGGFAGPGGVRRSGTPQLGESLKSESALWQRLNVCMDQLHSIVVAVWHLQRVLCKKRDPFTHVLLLDEVLQEGDPTLTDRVWEALVNSFSSQLKSTSTASSFVNKIFTSGYPKLLSITENILERISRDTDVKGVPPALSSEGKDQLIAAIGIFQSEFLADCLRRMSAIVNSVFPMSSRSRERIEEIVKQIQKEIEAVQLDERLTFLVLHQIAKSLRLLAEKAEYQVSTGPEARQITGPATQAQLKNFALCLHLQEIYTRIFSLMGGLPVIAAEPMSPTLDDIYRVACDSVASLFQAMREHLESCILKIHDQNFHSLPMDAARDNYSSPYMEELQESILHFRNEFLKRLLPKSASAAGTEFICTGFVRNMASRVLIFFIQQASLVRPLSESGKLRMAKDMVELELAVKSNLFPVEQLGAPYRALRAFRPVLFMETSQLENPANLQDLPLSVILHHLYSRAPDELQSPVQRNRLTPQKYSLWLEDKGEDQIWTGIKATLDDYAAKVKARGDKEFTPVYPLMLKLGSTLSGNKSKS